VSRIKKNNSFFILMLIAVLSFTLIATMNMQAKEISLEEALNWGIEHNSSIKEIKDNIETIERSLDLIDTEYGFKTNISANPIIAGSYEEPTDNNSIGIDNGDNDSGISISPKISLKTTKLFPNGLILQSEISLKEEDWFDLEKLSEGPNSIFSATKSIYPVLPIESEQEKYLASNNLLKARENLTWQQEYKEIEFLESYFNLLRLQERLSLAETNFQYAREDLNKILRKIVIGEAGERQEIEAKIALKKAEINLLQAQNNFLQQKNRWYLNLNLSEEVEVSFKQDLPFLEEIIKWIDSLELNLKEEELMELIVANHYQIINNQLDQDSEQKEAEWNLAKNKPQVDLFGAYSSKDNGWGVGIELSYDIFDGGKQKIEDEGYQVKLENLEDDYSQIVSELRLELSDLINQQEINNLNLEEKLMSWEKAKLEEESYQAQLQQGLISDSEFQYKMLGWQESEINLKSAKDEILINKLRIAHFLLIIGVIIILIAAIFIWYRFFKVSDEGLADQNINININPGLVTSVERGNLKKTVSTSGYLQPADEKLLTFNLNGEIEEILIAEGQRVSEGEELMQLDKSKQELNYLKAKNAYELIKTSGSESEINEQELNFQIAKKNLEDTTLKTPFSGLITEVPVTPGDYVQAGTKVGYLIDDSSYEIEVSVNEIDSLEVEVGQEVIITLDAFPGREFLGRVREIHNYTKNVNGVVTLPVIVQLDQVEKQFKPGFSALLEIIVGKAEGGLLVPITAILGSKGQQMVVKVVDNKPVFTQVKTGFSDGVYTVVEGGLAEGDQILINVYEFAKAGSKNNLEASTRSGSPHKQKQDEGVMIMQFEK
jgi:multidrug efflux pump subunit AcrA (membrane-fusion protein)